MRCASPIRIFLAAATVLLILGFCSIMGLRLMLSRTREFRAQAKAGQPIVRAIEEFRKQSGHYPVSLADIAPKYLQSIPETPDESQHKFIGWDYRRVTNGATISYTLRYYMGRGGIEYDPPVWYGNDEGHRTVLLKNP